MRRVGQNKISLFNIMLTLFAFSAIVILYVNNIITVNSLLAENNNIMNEINSQSTLNNSLQTEIEKLTNYENIKKLLDGKIDLKPSALKPKTIIVKEQYIMK
jgi:cell division protein FtsL